MRTVAFGELLWDLLPSGRTLGGAPFNFIYRVVSLGAEGLMITRLGRDDLGREAHGILRDLGLDDRLVQWDTRRPTGTVPVRFDAQGIPDITIDPDVAYDYIEPARPALEAVREADCLCFGTLIQRTPTSRETLRTLLGAFRGSVRFLDLNLRKDCWTPETVRQSIEAADVLKLNDEEARTVGGIYGLPEQGVVGFARALLDLADLEHVIVTLGARGALAASRRGEVVYCPAFRVRVQDTLGSGDAFSAAFLHGLDRGWPLARTVRFGCAAGALVAGQRGATEPFAAQEVERMAEEGATAEGEAALAPYLSRR